MSGIVSNENSPRTVIGRVAATFPATVQRDAVVAALRSAFEGADGSEHRSVWSSLRLGKVHKAVLSMDFCVDTVDDVEHQWVTESLPHLLARAPADLHDKLAKCITDFQQAPSDTRCQLILQRYLAADFQLTSKEAEYLAAADLDKFIGDAVRHCVQSVLRDAAFPTSTLPPLAVRRALMESFGGHVRHTVFPFERLAEIKAAALEASLREKLEEEVCAHAAMRTERDNLRNEMQRLCCEHSSSIEKARQAHDELQQQVEQLKVELAHWKQRADEADLALMLNMPDGDGELSSERDALLLDATQIVSSQYGQVTQDSRLTKLLELREQQVQTMGKQLLDSRKEVVELRRRLSKFSVSSTDSCSRSASAISSASDASQGLSRSASRSTAAGNSDMVPLCAVRALEHRCEEAERELRERTKQIAVLLVEQRNFQKARGIA